MSRYRVVQRKRKGPDLYALHTLRYIDWQPDPEKATTYVDREKAQAFVDWVGGLERGARRTEVVEVLP